MVRSTTDRGGNGSLRLELYARRDAFGARTQQQRLFERVRRLEGRPGIEGTRVRRWPDRIIADETTAVVGLVREFETWAMEHDRSLEPCFGRREVEPGFADERYEQIVLPIVCLAVYRDGRLDRVAPHVDGGRPYTVPDCIAELEERPEVSDDGPPRRSDTVVSR